MKKFTSILLAVLMVAMCLIMNVPQAQGAANAEKSRAIAIVFDNSGSMYDSGDQAWCRATYAMEVFASMLNKGDILQIYPMHSIMVGDMEFTMESPLQITDATQAPAIREIFTPDAAGTPIESIDCAVNGVRNLGKDKKYVIVLTDGGTFSKGGYGLSKERTKVELDNRIEDNAGPELNFMYLGIGSDACVPESQPSEYFVKKQAINTADVLSALTEMCNLVFGRDSLPKGRISGNNINFDISMKKIIVFVQGDNISNLKLSSADGGEAGAVISSMQTKHSTLGAGDYKSVADTSLQGMMVTYADCDAGSYTIDYAGNATSVEVYYEPDADLEFVFTDSNGNNVDLNSLYEGEYKVSFGMKDAKTGELISSDLLGNPHYHGSYTVNGQAQEFTYDGQSGEVPINLAMNDAFEAELTVTYLSGYTITKNSSDFGWPEGGIRVLAPPLGVFDVQLEMSKDYLLIKEIEKSDPIKVNLTIGGKKLTPDEFDAVEIQVDTSGLEHEVKVDEANADYYIRLLSSKGLDEGRYKITVDAKYLDIADREAQDSISANVTLSNTPLWIKWVGALILLIILFIIIWSILHIKVFPTKAHTTKNLSNMSYDMQDVSNDTNFSAIVDKQPKVVAKYGGMQFGLKMNAKPGADSYLYKPQKRRSFEIDPNSVSCIGQAKIQEAMIGNVMFTEKEGGGLEPAIPGAKNIVFRNGNMIRFSGTVEDGGASKDFEVRININFNKK